MFNLIFKMSDFNSQAITYLSENLIRYVKLHPVRLEILFNKFKLNNDPIIEKYEITEEQVRTNTDLSEDVKNLLLGDFVERSDEEIKEIKNKLNWDTVVFPNQTVLHTYSLRTGNDDTRGGGCGDCGFTTEDFKYTLTNNNGITFRNLLESIYRMKGSKYDYWYELLHNVEINIENETIKMQVSFDYGS